MIKNSLVCRFFLWLVSLAKAVIHVFSQSAVYRAVCSVVDFFADAYGKSRVHSLFTKKDIEENSHSSLFYGAVGFFTRLAEKIAAFFLVNTDKMKHSSLSSRFLSGAGKGSVVVKAASPAWNFAFSFTGAFSLLMALVFVVPHAMWNNTYALLISLLMAFVVLCAASCGRKYVQIAPDKLWLSFIFFAFSTVLSTLLSKDVSDSIRVLAFFLTSFVMCLSVSSILCSKAALRRFLLVMYLVTIVTSIVAVYQGVVGVEADASLTDLSVNADMPGRVYSTLGNPNNFAEFLVLFVPFSFVFAIGIKNKALRAFSVCLLALPMAALLLTYSRSGWIAFAVAAVVFVVLYDRRLIPALIIIGLCAIPALPESIMNRILTIGNLGDSSSSYRLDIWAGCIDMLKKWWFTGIGLGPGAFGKIYPPYAYGVSSVAPHSHMQFMEILIESGFIGLVSYVWMTFDLIKRSCIASKCSDKYLKNTAIAGASAMAGIILIGLFEYCWFYPRVMFAFFICAGIVMAVCKMSKNNVEK